MSEFDNLKGLPPDKLPYKPKPIPNELKEVEKPVQKKVKLNFSDYWNIVWAIVSDYALKKLNPIQQKTVMKIQTVLSLFGGIIILLGIVYCIKSCN